jgi:hypothetical protein
MDAHDKLDRSITEGAEAGDPGGRKQAKREERSAAAAAAAETLSLSLASLLSRPELALLSFGSPKGSTCAGRLDSRRWIGWLLYLCLEG